MNEFSSHPETQDSPPDALQFPSTAPRVVIIVGSLWQSLVEYLRFIRYSVCLVIDVPTEIESLKIHPAARASIQLQKSGRNYTIKSLADVYGTAEQRAAMESLPNMSLEDGIGQVRGYGAMAVQEVMDRADYQAFKRQLPGTLLAAAGGELPRVVLDAYFGTAGGQASRGGQLIWEDILHTLLGETNATIDTSIHLIGGISFTGPAFPRTQANSSASIAQWMHRNQQLPGSRVNMTTYLGELPPVGTNKPLRTQLLLDRYNAMTAPAVEKNIQAMRTNRAAGGPFGNVLLVRSDHYRGITKEEIVHEIASAYLPRLIQTSRVRGDSALLRGIQFEYEQGVDSRPSIDGALMRAFRSGDAELLSGLVMTRRDIRAQPELVLSSGQCVDLLRAREYFNRPIHSLNDVQNRFKLLKAAIPLTELEITDLRRQYTRLEAFLERNVEQSELIFERLLVRNHPKLQNNLLTLLSQVRRLFDELEEVHAELDSLRKALGDLQRELGEFSQRIGRLIAAVKACAPQTPRDSRQRRLKPLALSPRVGMLLAVADTMGEDLSWMHHTLSTMAGHVSLEGLAQITNATSATVESVVAEVIARRHVRKGPNWGGVTREDQCDAFLIYPPVEPIVQERLLERHKQLGHDLNLISFARSADCSVNVSVLELRTCSELREILTPHYQSGLSQILASNTRPLFLSDVEILKDLGIAGVDSVAATGSAK